MTTTTRKTTTTTTTAPAIGPVSNDALPVVVGSAPYAVGLTVEGVCPLLFHRWSNEAVAAKAAAAKGSAAKKTDDVEASVWRREGGEIGMPGEYLRQSIITAAKYRQDPRSPRKSAMDLYKAGVVALTDLAPLGSHTWDYLDQRRVTVQRNAVTRVRPAFNPGWIAEFDLQVQLPEYIQPKDLLDVLVNAGRLVGIGDFRPTYGRFQVTKFAVLEAT
jgi:hypothetical protein